MAGVVDTLNRVKFVSEEFQTYRTQAEEFFQAHYPDDFNNLISTDLGNALMDQLAYAMMALTFTVNRRVSELYLDTAQIPANIVKLARSQGKSIDPAAPATTDIVATFTDAPYSFPIPIPPGFQFQGPGDVIYEYRGNSNLILAAGETSLTIPAKEGNSRRISFISDGSELQRYEINGIPSDNYLYSDSMALTVDGTLWTRTDIIKFEPEDVYEVLFTTSPPQIRFGDGVAGNIPPENAQIALEYVYGKGAAGQIGSNQISGALSPLVVNGQIINMTFTNTSSTPGEDPESIQSIRSNASVFFRTQSAAVIKQDYDDIAELRPGVILADAQIIRGVDRDLTISSFFSSISGGVDLVSEAAQIIATPSVSGLGFLGVSGVPSLSVGGTGGLDVGNTGQLGVSGTEFLGCDVSGNVTGIGLLGVSGQSGLQVIGQGGLFVSGTDSLGVSGTSFIGIDQDETYVEKAVSGAAVATSGTTGLHDHLSQHLSDTSKANKVQVVVLSTDLNNKYIAPSTSVLTDVQATLQNQADAVVTVEAVDGTPNLVEADVLVELGISQTAVENDVVQNSLNALTQTNTPFGIMVRRSAGACLFLSDIHKAIRDANVDGDIVFINAKITHPVDKVDSDGNLEITKQQIIQNRNVTVKVVKRFVSNNCE